MTTLAPSSRAADTTPLSCQQSVVGEEEMVAAGCPNKVTWMESGAATQPFAFADAKSTPSLTTFTVDCELASQMASPPSVAVTSRLTSFPQNSTSPEMGSSL